MFYLGVSEVLVHLVHMIMEARNCLYDVCIGSAIMKAHLQALSVAHMKSESLSSKRK